MLAEVPGPIRRSYERDRIAVLDVLRGLAILLILVVNIPDMGNLNGVADNVIGWSVPDQVAWWLQRVFVYGTQRGVLQLLFGAGIVMMTSWAMRADGPLEVAAAFHRRNLWLAVFGLAHVFIFLRFNDILFVYGVAALLIFRLRTLKARTLILIGAGALVLLGMATGAQHFRSRATFLEDVPAARAAAAAGKALSAEQQATLVKWDQLQDVVHGTGPGIARQRAAHAGSFADYYAWAIGMWFGIAHDLPKRILESAATMLIGAALFKWGVLQGGQSARFYLLMLLGCYAAGLPLRLLEAREIAAFTSEPKLWWITAQPSRLLMTLGHVALVCLTAKSHAGQRLLQPFQAAGRVPLSVYFGQSVLCMFILFPSFGLGLWGRFSWAGLTVIAIVVSAATVVLANVWLRHFDSGPFEWLWKSLAYWRWQPFRKPTAKHVVTE